MEDALSDESKANLWTERSNHLRLLGRPHEALAAIDAVGRLRLRPDQQLVFAQNRAILLREIGRPDSALALMERIVQEVPTRQRIEVLISIWTTAIALGRYSRADEALREARSLAVGPYARARAELDLFAAPQLARNGQVEEAKELLRGLPPADELTFHELIAAVVAWAALPDAVDEPQARAVTARLNAIADEAAAAGDQHGAREALWTVARTQQEQDHPEAAKAWERYLAACGELSAARPIALMFHAWHRWEAAQLDAARAALTAIPAALAEGFGAADDIDSVAKAHQELRHSLPVLAEAIIGSGTARVADVRLLAELQRDGIARARLLRRQREQLPRDGLDAAVLAELAPEQGALHVIEWLELPDQFITLRTAIAADGTVATTSAETASRERIAYGDGAAPDPPPLPLDRRPSR